MSKSFLDAPLILLAGGKSSRLGMPKGLFPFQGSTWLEEQILSWGKVGGKSIVLVLGFHKEDYLKKLQELSTPLPSLKITINPNPDYGPFTSIQEGLKNTNSDSIWILPIDVPVPDKTTWESLWNNTTESHFVGLPTFRGKGGHPVLASRNFSERLLSVSMENTNARLDRQIQSLSKDQVLRLEVKDKKIIENLNTAEDFEAYLKSHKEKR